MSKNLGRDIQVLIKILMYMEKIKDVLKRYRCKTQDCCRSSSFEQLKDRIKYCQENKMKG